MIFLDNVLDKDEITENLIYFVNYWEYFCRTIENPTVYSSVMTPHYLVKEIIDELKTNGTDNSSTFKYFLEENEIFLKHQILFSKEIKSLWILLHEKLAEKEKQEIVINSIVEKLNKQFTSKQYNEYIFGELKKYLISKESSFDTVRILTETLILQLLFEQYSIKTIIEILKNVFASYNIYETEDGKKHFSTSFPLKTKYNDENPEEYLKSATEEMQNLTLENRLQELLNYLKKDKQLFYFIFYIKGIHFEKEINFDDVAFYNPIKHPLLEAERDIENDTFHNANYEIGMNVIVKQDGRDIIRAKQEAIEKAEKICDIIKLYDNAKAKFHLYDSDYRVLNEEKKLLTWAMGISKDFVTPYDVIRDDETIENATNCFSEIFNNLSISEHDKTILIDSLHFYRKAKESDSQEEKLLNYWISLERLFLDFDTFSSKFERTMSFTRCFLLERFIFQKGWNCYNYINGLLTTKTMHKGQFCPEINIPKELQLKANIGEFLTYPINIELIKFLDAIPEIKLHSTNIVANNMMQNVYDFYKKHETARTEVMAKYDEIRNELLMIYRQRNQIVHNATYDKTLIEFNIAQIQSIVTMVIYDILHGLKNEPSLSNVIMDIYVKTEQDIYLATKDENFLFIEKCENKKII